MYMCVYPKPRNNNISGREGVGGRAASDGKSFSSPSERHTASYLTRSAHIPCSASSYTLCIYQLSPSHQLIRISLSVAHVPRFMALIFILDALFTALCSRWRQGCRVCQIGRVGEGGGEGGIQRASKFGVLATKQVIKDRAATPARRYLSKVHDRRRVDLICEYTFMTCTQYNISYTTREVVTHPRRIRKLAACRHAHQIGIHYYINISSGCSVLHIAHAYNIILCI